MGGPSLAITALQITAEMDGDVGNGSFKVGICRKKRITCGVR